MKKLYFLVASLFIGATAISQETVYTAGDATAFGEWSIVDADEDGFNWGLTDVTDFGATWSGQGEVMVSYSYDNDSGTALTPDNWAVSPAIDLSGYNDAELSWGRAAVDADWAGENYSVYVVSAADATAALVAFATATAVYTETIANDDWVVRTVDISDFDNTENVFIAIRHHDCTDMFAFIVDDITVTGNSGPDCSLFSLDLATSNATGCGAADGEITLSLTPDTEDFSFTLEGNLYNSALSTITVNTLTAGSYNFVVTTNDSNCELEVSATIGETGAPEISVTATEPTCFGDDDAVLSVTSADDISGYTFTWSTNDVGTSITGGAGAYTVSGTDGACIINGSVTVTQPAEVVLNLSATAISCNGEEDAVITITSSEDISGYTFTWSTADIANTITVGDGTYTVSGTDGTCESNGSITVTDPAVITIVGGVLGADIAANATGGTGTLSYAWSGPSSFTATGQAISVTENGTYTLTVTDANNCTSSAEYVVSSVSLFTNELENISAYPNPTNDKINFNLNGTNAAFVTIYDAAGKFIATLNVEDSFTSMNVSTIAEGLYIYHIMSNDGNMLTSSKFMVVK